MKQQRLSTVASNNGRYWLVAIAITCSMAEAIATVDDSRAIVPFWVFESSFGYRAIVTIGSSNRAQVSDE
jgi:hypothetical protein